jgi:tetratricopeptide (TPR) repeat protein
MTADHIDLDLLNRFVARELEREEMMEVGWHLFLCDRCRELLDERGEEGRALFDEMFGGVRLKMPPDGYSGVLGRLAEQLQRAGLRIEQERVTAPRLHAELLRHPATRQHWMVENSARYQIYGLAEHLLAECRERWSEDPVRAEEMAELALTVTQRLDPQLHGWGLINDLMAECWAYIANCRRIGSDLRRVAEAFEIAEGYRQRGTGDAVEEAALLDLKASYLRDQRRFDEATGTLERVIELYRAANDQHLVGRVLIQKAILLHELGDADGAIESLSEAQHLVDIEREPQLAFTLKNNLALYLAEIGRASEASHLLPELRELARRVGTRLQRLRFLWVEGLVCSRLGQHGLAEAVLRQARDGFIEAGIGYDAALVSLDLAQVLLETGRSDEAKDLARQMVPIFTSRDVHREALAALAVFQRAIDDETATLALAREVADYLQRARHNPSLRYQRRA